jgi:enolase-phosphatase E1
VTVTLSASWVVLDIEGTLTATSQVHVVLYDYARPRLAGWIEAHPDDPEVRDAVAQVKKLGGLRESASTDEVVAVLHRWMATDQKFASLKTLQGLIWQHGYRLGELTTTFFPDVVPALRAWHRSGLNLAVFSSGSVAGQIASFSRTTDGDLTMLFSRHFDTVNAGPKREEPSYRAMTKELGVDPGTVVFLSDVPAELDAAAMAGWRTVGLARAGEPYAGADFGPHPTISSFDQIQLRPA